jgi:hypothetical protein
VDDIFLAQLGELLKNSHRALGRVARQQRHAFAISLQSSSLWVNGHELRLCYSRTYPNRGSSDQKLLLPAAAEGLVELNESLQLIELGLDQRQFIGKVVGLVGKHFEVSGGAGFEAHLGQTRGVLG